jgi:iron complex outermembrane receptor protein
VVSIALLLAGIVVPGAAQQAAAVSGLISDPNGAAVTGARVELLGGGASRSASTDGGGRYRFEGLSAGEYTVRVTAPGHLPIDRSVRVASSAVVVDIQLEVIALAGIVVSAEQQVEELEAQRALTPGGVTILAVEDLTRRPINGLADMLRYVPGVWAESSAGADELFMSSRGSNLDATDYDKNGIKLLQDGLPVTSADGNNHNRIIDPLSASYAVVARGANALTYGASTLGGAMDFISPTARNTPGLSGVFNSGGYGPFNGRVSLGATSGSVDGLVTVEGRQWDGYRDHSSLERWGVYANGGWLASEVLEVRLFGTFMNSTLELPDALTRSEIDANPDQASSVALGGDYGKDLTTARGAVRMTWTPSPNRSFVAGLSYEGQALFHPIVDRVMVDFDGPGPNPPVEVFSLIVDTDHRDLGAVARYNHVVGAHDLALGVNYGRASVEGGNYRNLGGQRNGLNEYVDNSAESVEAFFMDRWRASDRLTLVAGAQFVSTARDVRTTDAGSGALSNPKRDYNSFNPRAGVIAALTPAPRPTGT